MNTIVLNLDAPIQSWAGPSAVKTRVDSDRKPSVRAVKGLIASALGLPRGEAYPAALLNAKVEVETVKQGSIIHDFQTIGDQKAERAGSQPHDNEFYQKLALIYTQGKASKINGITLLSKPEIIRRSYLADAQFLVYITGVTPEDTETLHNALKHPKWSSFLGRKAFPPSFAFLLGSFPETEASNEAHNIITMLKRELTHAAR